MNTAKIAAYGNIAVYGNIALFSVYKIYYTVRCLDSMCSISSPLSRSRP